MNEQRYTHYTDVNGEQAVRILPHDGTSLALEWSLKQEARILREQVKGQKLVDDAGLERLWSAVVRENA